MNRVISVKRWILFALAVAMASAVTQRATAATTTNLALTMGWNLTAYVQSTNASGLPSVTVTRLATKDIVAALGTDQGKSSNQLVSAKVLFRFISIGATNETLNAVLETAAGDTVVDTNLFVSLVGTPEVDTIRASGTGTKKGTVYSIMECDLATTNLSFNAKGEIRLSDGSLKMGSTLIDPRRFPAACSASLTGTGKVGTNTATFIGTYSLTNPKAEVRTQ